MSFYGIKKITNWFDQHGLFALSLFLLIFIPLYPKIPLLEAIPGYLVRVRLEDLLIFSTGIIWFIQLIRKKIKWKSSFHFLIILYALVGLISLLISTVLQQTIPLQLIHISKSFLHYFRYLEYFSLFLFMHAGIKSQRHVQISLTTIVIILNFIFIYGIGQRYFEWPAFSTMNREFSKGEALILAPEIKLHSTFGGHYDLAAYLVIILPIITAWVLRTQKRLFKLWLVVSIMSGLWLLIESASKTALIGCVVGILSVIWFSLYQKWGIIKSSLISLILGLLLGGSALGGLWLWKKPTLYKVAPFLRTAEYQTPVDVETILDETWSKNAQRYGLSMGIRLDTLWPNAFDAFSINPFTGKGYATLNKKGVNEFTEADSTDNNFLRVLGETGVLGFITFFGVIYLIIKTLLIKLPKDILNQSLVVGFIAATVGLFINAFIIDVFAASKVAFTYWAIAGLSLKSFSLINKKRVEKQETIRLKNTINWLKKYWPLLITSILLIFLVHKRPFTEYSLVKSFALSTNQAKYVATTKCFFENQGFKQCLNKYQPGLGLTYSLYLFPFYSLYQNPAIFYFANLILIIGTIILLDSLIKKFTNNSVFRFLLLTIIFTTPGFYTLPTKSTPINLWLFLTLILFNKLFSKNKQRNVSKLLNLILLVTTFIHLGLVQYFVGTTSSILASFRDTYRPSNYVAIRRANRYLSTRISKDKPQPILLTSVEPVLFDLYGLDIYQIQPIEDENLEAHHQLIDTKNQELFITNANVDQDLTLKEAFEAYKHQFGVTLREIDCRHACNYYQLLPEEIKIPTQPQTWNNTAIPQDLSDPKIIVISDQVVMEIGSGKYLTPDKLLLKQELIDQRPDVIFITGDIKEERMKHFGESFLKRMHPELNIPIVAVPSDFNAPKYTFPSPQFQRFTLGENWVITLDAASHHRSPEQNRFLYDTLLQLEKHPEVKKVYIISQDDQWLKQHPENYYFAEDFQIELKEHSNVRFEFIYPDKTEANF